MKHILPLLLLLIYFGAEGQTKRQDAQITPITVFKQAAFDPHPVVILNAGSDTLEVCVPLRVHFIKIGKSVYEIKEHEPTLEFVQPKLVSDSTIQGWFPNIQNFPIQIWPRNIQPITIDSSGKITPDRYYF